MFNDGFSSSLDGTSNTFCLGAIAEADDTAGDFRGAGVALVGEFTLRRTFDFPWSSGTSQMSIFAAGTDGTVLSVLARIGFGFVLRGGLEVFIRAVGASSSLTGTANISASGEDAGEGDPGGGLFAGLLSFRGVAVGGEGD